MDSIKIETIKNEETHHQIIQDQIEIETAIISHNQQHFSQAEGTPPTRYPLKQLLDDGHSKTCDDILRGSHEMPQSLPPLIQQYLKGMKRENTTSITQALITSELVKDGFKKWKEKTSTSP